MAARLFGWIPPAARTPLQTARTAAAYRALLPGFRLFGGYRPQTGRFSLWQLAERANGGKRLPYIHQLTGSCIGAGGGNGVMTCLGVEISQGGVYQFEVPWWLWAYGLSRHNLGDDSEGEGSTGGAYAQAITLGGELLPPAIPELPPLSPDRQGWTTLSESVESDWSAWPHHGPTYADQAKAHLVRSAAPIRSSAEAKAALQNGYPVLWAGNSGYNTIKPAGNPPVNLGTWDTTWPHQQFVDEVWDHPDLGLIFRKGNNWGPDAHPAPTQGEPPGGFYVKAADMDRDIREGAECFAISAFDGLYARSLDWGSI